MNKLNVLLDYYVSRRRKPTCPRRRCAVCYGPVKPTGRNYAKYCCNEHRLLARRIRDRNNSQAKEAGSQQVLQVTPMQIIHTKRRPGTKIIKCCLCRQEFDAPGVYVGDRVIPNVRTCPNCESSRDKLAKKFDETSLSSPYATLFDDWHCKDVLRDHKKKRNKYEPKPQPV